jgi:hemerythrin-like metal-binding protein
MFEWKDEYLVGVTAIDQQHKRLFEVAGRFHDAIVANKGKDVLEELLFTLVRDTENHYLLEERLMMDVGFPGRQQHAADHKALREELLTFQKRFGDGETVTIQVLQFLSRWLTGHTSPRDRGFGEYYRTSRSTSSCTRQ